MHLGWHVVISCGYISTSAQICSYVNHAKTTPRSSANFRLSRHKTKQNIKLLIKSRLFCFLGSAYVFGNAIRIPLVHARIFERSIYHVRSAFWPKSFGYQCALYVPLMFPELFSIRTPGHRPLDLTHDAELNELLSDKRLIHHRAVCDLYLISKSFRSHLYLYIYSTILNASSLCVAQFSLIFSKRVSLKYHSLLLAHTEYLAAARVHG